MLIVSSIFNLNRHVILDNGINLHLWDHTLITIFLPHVLTSRSCSWHKGSHSDDLYLANQITAFQILICKAELIWWLLFSLVLVSVQHDWSAQHNKCSMQKYIPTVYRMIVTLPSESKFLLWWCLYYIIFDKLQNFKLQIHFFLNNHLPSIDEQTLKTSNKISPNILIFYSVLKP
jgi:hypothetical protein